MMKTKLSIMLLFAMAFFSVPVFSEPTSVATTIVSIRPYIGGSVFVQVASNVLCQTSVFSIDTSKPNGKAAYAAALTAMLANKKVMLEISSATGCATGTPAGWGTELQSIYVLAQ